MNCTMLRYSPSSSLALFCLFVFNIICLQAQYITLEPAESSQQPQNVYQNGTVTPLFAQTSPNMNCASPELYIYQQTQQDLNNNTPYSLIIGSLQKTVQITVDAQYDSFKPSVYPSTCVNSCVINIQNNCPVGAKFAMNIFTFHIGDSISFSYRINCNNSYVFKPFQWGLFLLIFATSIVITASSLYSRAWSYGGYGFDISFKFIIFFNILLIIFVVIASAELITFLPTLINVLGCLFGLVGVTICTNEFLWIFKKRNLNNRKVWNKIRVIDIVSFTTGSFVTILYWATNQNWIITDIMSICTIVAAIKFFKLTSLRMAFYLLTSVLLVEIVFGLIVHYGMKVSYNYLVINSYNSPFLVELPSITPELYRKCSWLPVTSLILPGLLLSYLRRFDISRNTYLYLLLGYVSLYLGSILWMLIDMATSHTLPFAIVSDPATLLTIFVFAFKRNQFKTLWNGHFYDPEINFKEGGGLILDRGHEGRYTEYFKDIEIYQQL